MTDTAYAKAIAAAEAASTAAAAALTAAALAQAAFAVADHGSRFRREAEAATNKSVATEAAAVEAARLWGFAASEAAATAS
jgi:hypothetical protein